MKLFTKLCIYACLVIIFAVSCNKPEEIKPNTPEKPEQPEKPQEPQEPVLDTKEIEAQLETLNSNIKLLHDIVNLKTDKISVLKLDSTETKEKEVIYELYFSNKASIKIPKYNTQTDITRFPIIGTIEKENKLFWRETIGKNSKAINIEGKEFEITKESATPTIGIDKDGFWTVNIGSSNYKVTDENKVSPLAEAVEQKKTLTVCNSIFKTIYIDDNSLIIKLIDEQTTLNFEIDNSFFFFVKEAPVKAIFTLGEVKKYKVNSFGIKDIKISSPDGWSAEIKEDSLQIIAPTQKQNLSGSEAVKVIATDLNDKTTEVSIGVGLKAEIPEGVTNADFDVKITELTGTQVKAEIKAINKTQQYYIYPFDGSKTEAECIQQMQKRFKNDIEEDPSGSYIDYIYTGDKNYKYSNLAEGLQYNLMLIPVVYNKSAKTLTVNGSSITIPFTTPEAEIINTTYLINVSNISWYGATYQITPSDDLPYFHAFVKKEDFENFASDEEFAQDFLDNKYLYKYWDELLTDYTLEWNQLATIGATQVTSPGFLEKDPKYTSEDVYPLEQDTEYYVVVFRADESGYYASPKVTKALFKTEKFKALNDCKLTITAEVDRQDIIVKVNASNADCTYVTYIDERDNYSDNFKTPSQYAPYDLFWRLAVLKDKEQTLKESSEFYKGNCEYRVKDLKGATAYIVFAYGCTEDGTITTETQLIEVVTKGMVEKP